MNDKHTLDELKSIQKTLTVIVYMLSASIIVYAIFFVYRLASGTWQTGNLLEMVGLMMLVVASSLITIRRSFLDAEIKKRS